MQSHPSRNEDEVTDDRHKSAHPGEPYDNAIPGQMDNDTAGPKGYQPPGGAAGAMKTQQKTAAELGSGGSAVDLPNVAGVQSASSLKVVLVDVDGTLVDSNDGHARAWVRALSAHGYSCEFDAIRPMIGKGGDKVLLELAGLDEESAQAKAILNTRKATFAREELPHIIATPGAAKLLSALRAAGLKVVVATSAAGDESRAILEQAGLENLFDSQATSSDAQDSKPDPDIIHAALRKAGVVPSEVVMLGDTPYDIAAAMKAGVPCVALRCGGWWNNADLAGAAGIFSDPAELLAHVDQSLIGPALRAAGSSA